MPKKYAKMIIHIPIEIYENGDYQIFEDRTTMNVEPCAELPPVYKSERDSVLDVLTNMLLPKERIKWKNEKEREKDIEVQELEEEEEEDDFEEDAADTEEEDEEEEEDIEIKEETKPGEPKKEEEIRIFSHEIKPNKIKNRGNVMSFKKQRHLKANFTRKIRFL
jgi:hypothetical protein